ncbi:MAG: GIY-YIG nuclease family protein [Oscillospiraceae bacterium]|nr:GIY-YIG nuclease family protein [Oscillospiraceae bacterium]
MYYIYIVRCEDDTLYTGTAADIVRRLRTHLRQTGACARYTRSHRVVSLEALWETEEKGNALRLEYHIKQLTRAQKLDLLSRRIVLPIDGDYRRTEDDLLSKIFAKAL